MCLNMIKSGFSSILRHKKRCNFGLSTRLKRISVPLTQHQFITIRSPKLMALIDKDLFKWFFYHFQLEMTVVSILTHRNEWMVDLWLRRWKDCLARPLLPKLLPNDPLPSIDPWKCHSKIKRFWQWSSVSQSSVWQYVFHLFRRYLRRRVL